LSSIQGDISEAHEFTIRLDQLKISAGDKLQNRRAKINSIEYNLLYDITGFTPSKITMAAASHDVQCDPETRYSPVWTV
jgi:hypothetical protein